VGILLSLDVGLFSVVSLAALALFLPSEFWTIVEPHRQRLVRVFVGRARQWLGERAWARAIDLMSSRPGPQPLAEQPRWRTCVQGVLTVAIMSYVVWISFYQLLPQQVPRIPTDVRNVASFFRFNQKFALFAYVSDEPTFDQLHAIGLLEDGSRRFLMDGSIYDPERIAAGYRASFPSHRWVKWFIKMRRDERIHRPFAEYQCRASVSAEPGSRLQRVELRLVSVSLDGVPLRDERMLSHDCALLP
jgi:hypothetical protein